MPEVEKRGFICNINSRPVKVIEGTRFRLLDELDQVKAHLDMFLRDTLISTKVISKASEYVSPYEVRENQTYGKV